MSRAGLRPGLVAFAPVAIATAHFGFIYAFAALACARGFADARVLGFGIVPAIIILATAVAVALIGAAALVTWRAHPRRRGEGTAGARFVADAALTLAGLALATAVLTAAPALFVPPCR
jgi:hypothetical protein